jgi:hypothetical protein
VERGGSWGTTCSELEIDRTWSVAAHCGGGEGKESTNTRTLKPKIASAVLRLGGWGVLSRFVMNTRVKVLEDFFF